MAQAFYVEGVPPRTYAEWDGTEECYNVKVKPFAPEAVFAGGVLTVNGNAVIEGEYIVEAEGGGLRVVDESTFQGQYRAY